MCKTFRYENEPRRYTEHLVQQGIPKSTKLFENLSPWEGFLDFYE